MRTSDDVVYLFVLSLPWVVSSFGWSSPFSITQGWGWGTVIKDGGILLPTCYGVVRDVYVVFGVSGYRCSPVWVKLMPRVFKVAVTNSVFWHFCLG